MEVTKNGQTRTVGSPESAAVYLAQGWTVVGSPDAPVAAPEPELPKKKAKK